MRAVVRFNGRQWDIYIKISKISKLPGGRHNWTPLIEFFKNFPPYFFLFWAPPRAFLITPGAPGTPLKNVFFILKKVFFLHLPHQKLWKKNKNGKSKFRAFQQKPPAWEGSPREVGYPGTPAGILTTPGAPGAQIKINIKIMKKSL